MRTIAIRFQTVGTSCKVATGEQQVLRNLYDLESNCSEAQRAHLYRT